MSRFFRIQMTRPRAGKWPIANESQTSSHLVSHHERKSIGIGNGWVAKGFILSLLKIMWRGWRRHGNGRAQTVSNSLTMLPGKAIIDVPAGLQKRVMPDIPLPKRFSSCWANSHGSPSVSIRPVIMERTGFEVHITPTASTNLFAMY